MLALALGANTIKMNHGHHGANHPVKEIATGKVEVTSMNHGFTVDSQTLPAGVAETHVSLFDGSNCGIALTDRPVFSVQHHPEASPGPQDSWPYPCECECFTWRESCPLFRPLPGAANPTSRPVRTSHWPRR